MKLNVRIGDTIIVAGKNYKIIQISELSVEEKLTANIPSQVIARWLKLDNGMSLIFLS